VPSGLPGARGVPGSGFSPRVAGLPTGTPPSGPIVRAPGAAITTTQPGAALTDIAADPYYGQRSNSFQNPFPAWQPDFREFYLQGSAVVPAATTRAVLIAYDPSNNVAGYIQGVGQGAICAAFLETTWEIAIGGRIVQTFLPLGQVGTFLDMAKLTVPFLGGNRITLLVTTTTNPFTLAGQLRIQEKGLDVLSREHT